MHGNLDKETSSCSEACGRRGDKAKRIQNDKRILRKIYSHQKHPQSMIINLPEKPKPELDRKFIQQTLSNQVLSKYTKYFYIQGKRQG
jgi:hypothetical protein